MFRIYLNMGLFSVSQEEKRMGLNKDIKRPDWLTEEAIADMRHDLELCDNPYTKEEVLDLEYDGWYDARRYNAYLAIDILSEYGLLEDKADE